MLMLLLLHAMLLLLVLPILWFLMLILLMPSLLLMLILLVCFLFLFVLDYQDHLLFVLHVLEYRDWTSTTQLLVKLSKLQTVAIVYVPEPCNTCKAFRELFSDYKTTVEYGIYLFEGKVVTTTPTTFARHSIARDELTAFRDT